MNDRYNERLTYDANGNITQLKRWGKTDAGVTGLVDDVWFSYKGNQVVSATDHADAPTYVDAFHYSDNSEGSSEYAYDGNGNMTRNSDNKISGIQYNSLNLRHDIPSKTGCVSAKSKFSAFGLHRLCPHKSISRTTP